MGSSEVRRKLEVLAEALPSADQNSLNDWQAARMQRSISSVMDLAAAAANVAVNSSVSSVDGIDPLLQDAISETLPNWDPSSATDGAEWIGAINTAKGRYFEHLVVERLNSGDAVGDVVLPSGYTAQLASSLNNPGWDVQILDPNGLPSDFLQLKATDSLSYIHGAMEQYPEITFLSTSEVANSEAVLDSGITNDWLEGQTNAAFEGPDAINEFGALLGGFGAMTILAARTGWRIKMGEMDSHEAREYIIDAGSRSLTAQAAGFTSAWLVGGWFAVPAVVLSYWWMAKEARDERFSASIRDACQRLQLLRIYQQERLGIGAN